MYFKNAENTLERQPVKYIITERYAQECVGGIQKMYRLLDSKELVPEPVLAYEKPTYEGLNVDRLREKIEIEAIKASVLKGE